MKKIKDNILLTLIAIPIGMLIGAIASYFGQVLLIITDFRSQHTVWLVPFLAIGGLICVLAYDKLGGKSKQGMALLINAGHRKGNDIPLQLAPLIIGSTWLTHLFGGSAGREGVAVQIGGTISYNIGKKIKIEDADVILLIAGMASGFAGLFQTPLAATVFAIEIMTVGKLRIKAIAPSIAGAMSAYLTSGFLGLEKFGASIDVSPMMDIKTIGKLVIAGAVFGLTGSAFAFLLGKAKQIATKTFKNPYIKIGVIGAIVSVAILMIHGGRYAGLGTNLINASFFGEDVYTYDFALKFVLTIVTISAGYQGGEVTPLFSIGATLGIVLGRMLGLPCELLACLGYCTVFGSATKTIFTPMLLALEVFGANIMPQAIFVALIAGIFNFNQTIYKTQK